MIIREKVIVYPYNMEFTPLLRHRELLRNYEIAGLVSPKGWGLDCKDAGVADYGSEIGIKVTSDLVSMLDSCSTLILSDSGKDLDFNRIVYPNVEIAVKYGKNIVCLMKLKKEEKGCIEATCKENGVSFNYCRNDDSIYNSFEQDIQSDGGNMAGELEDISSPIIFVAGMSERTQKFEIQLAIREYLMNLGYKVSQIGSRSYCEVLGFHSFPTFMCDGCIAEWKKIIMFNRYVKTLEHEEKPDVFIIGLPGGIMALDRKFTNKFGILAYEVCQAVTPDAAVLSIFYENYNTEIFEMLASSTKFRLGFEPDCFNIVNARIDSQNSKLMNKVIYSNFSIKDFDKYRTFEDVEYPVCNILCTNGAASVANCLIDRLSSNCEVDYV